VCYGRRLPKSEPFSLRLSPELEAMVTEEAGRTRRSKGAVVEALAEEA
jgi:predicted transcriptional regulator